MTVSGPGGYTDVNETGFGSSDCSEIANYSSQAIGTCQLTFASSGQYTVTWTYTSLDLNYGSGATLVDTVDVS